MLAELLPALKSPADDEESEKYPSDTLDEDEESDD